MTGSIPASASRSTAFELLTPTRVLPSPRLGRFRMPKRNEILTPHYLALGSRGCVPHITPDMMLDHTSIQGLYTGFEDYAETFPSPPPFYALSSRTKEPLRTFTALPPSPLLVLGPRRHPAIPAPTHNAATTLNISTSVGFRALPIPSYITALTTCGADVNVAPADLDVGSINELMRGGQMVRKMRERPGRKRADHMVERSGAWMRGAVMGMETMQPNEADESGNVASPRPALWAPILPLDAEVQRSYLELLEENGEEEKITGLIIHETASIGAVPESMRHLPVLSLTEPRGPADVLDMVSIGIDLITMPFITRASEAGIAFTFTFPATKSASSTDEKALRPLGIDLWSTTHAQNTQPLVDECTCFACTRHTRAYIAHLLQAKEMLAWVLLQIHNHHIMNLFFSGIRESLTKETFHDDVQAWKRSYETEFPEFVGQGPRIRGYQSCTAGPLPKKKGFVRLEREDRKGQRGGKDEVGENEKRGEGIPIRQNDRKEKLAEGEEGQVLGKGENAVDLEDVGFAEVFNEDKS